MNIFLSFIFLRDREGPVKVYIHVRFFSPNLTLSQSFESNLGRLVGKRECYHCDPYGKGFSNEYGNG